MSTNQTAAGAGATAGAPVGREAPTEQQSSQAGAPKSFAPGQTVCNQKNEKGKLCNGHLKQTNTAGEDSLKHLRGEDVLYRCQTCGTLYMGPPLGHVRDPRKQTRFVERELMDILNAAGGTLPAFKLNERGAYVPATEAAHGAHVPAKPAAAPAAKAAAPAAATPAAAPAPAAPEETPEQKRARKLAEAAARKATAVPIPGAAGPPPEGETPEQKLARLKAVVAEAKRRKEAAAAGTPELSIDAAPTSPPPPSPTSGTDSSASADAHRPAAEAQAATGVASAVPLSPAAATASPAAGAETVADLGTDASTELTPGAPKKAKAEGSHSGFKVPAELMPQPGETQEQKLARLRATVEAAKRAAGKL
jgi:hypothetical protein